MPASRDGGLDRATLREVGHRLACDNRIERVSPFPGSKPTKLIVTIDSELYPDLITEVRVEMELRTSGDFFIHYQEDWGGNSKECRWDRHPTNHNSRDHYHPFPDAGRTDATDRDFPGDFLAVIEQVFTEIDERWGEVCGK